MSTLSPGSTRADRAPVRTSAAVEVGAVRGGVDEPSAVRHVMVVAGDLASWAALSERAWAERVGALGRVGAEAGASWVTIRPYEVGPDRSIELVASTTEVDGCVVIVDPCGDGRQRFAEAMNALAPDDPVNEASVAAALYAPAECEPDLTVVLGPSTTWPPSLVWEVAYAELVFLDVGWDDLGAGHLREALERFSGRRRRFGGLDT